LHFAIAEEREEVIEYLLRHRGDINLVSNKGETPYLLAKQGSNSDLFFKFADLLDPEESD